MQKEIARKSAHFLLAVFFSILFLYANKLQFVLVVILFFIIFLLSHFSKRYLKKSKVDFGEFFFLFGVLVTFFISFGDVKNFQVAMIILAVCDSLASIVGTLSVKPVYYFMGERRTIFGSLAFFLSSFIVFSVFGVMFVYAFFASLFLTLSEIVLIRGSDNLFLPIFAVLLFNLLK